MAASAPVVVASVPVVAVSAWELAPVVAVSALAVVVAAAELNLVVALAPRFAR